MSEGVPCGGSGDEDSEVGGVLGCLTLTHPATGYSSAVCKVVFDDSMVYFGRHRQTH